LSYEVLYSIEAVVELELEIPQLVPAFFIIFRSPFMEGNLAARWFDPLCKTSLPEFISREMVLDETSEPWAYSLMKILFFELQKLDVITICLQVCCSLARLVWIILTALLLDIKIIWVLSGIVFFFFFWCCDHVKKNIIITTTEKGPTIIETKLSTKIELFSKLTISDLLRRRSKKRRRKRRWRDWIIWLKVWCRSNH
jgi:hypothetical protein